MNIKKELSNFSNLRSTKKSDSPFQLCKLWSSWEICFFFPNAIRKLSKAASVASNSYRFLAYNLACFWSVWRQTVHLHTFLVTPKKQKFFTETFFSECPLGVLRVSFSFKGEFSRSGFSPKGFTENIHENTGYLNRGWITKLSDCVFLNDRLINNVVQTGWTQGNSRWNFTPERRMNES